ncbi:HAD family hydrolase [Aureimonas fodinaquatilis]|uniref:phosphoglycolate phosphatase n=1 Tax=Aureimonas fodinaquatilis TaxID=2565783 RepID=A0A5B0DZ50_9HYPH|nr:HAD family hydrolase [Aureimonas fodinaquatilis]KAA0972084.1 HAD family hydrolase [Aureimonas fodinaquatilis]
MAGLKGILFDKDGTLLDFDATWAPATHAVLEELSAGQTKLFEAMAAACGLNLNTMQFLPGSPIIAGDTADYAPVWADLLACPFDTDFEMRINALYRSASLLSLKGYDDVAPAIATLAKAGYQIGMATNDAESTARAHLRALGVEEQFSFVAGYDSGYGAKPAPGMVLAFADFLGVKPEQIALIGDSTHDMDAARAAGAHAIGIARTPAARDALNGHTDITVTDLQGLIDEVTNRVW